MKKKLKSSCTNYRGILVSSVHARLAPFSFLANLSLVVFLLRAIECLQLPAIPSSSHLLHAIRQAFNAIKTSIRPELAIFFLLHFIISALFLTAGRISARRLNSRAPAITEYYAEFEVNNFHAPEEHNLLLNASPSSDSADVDNEAGGAVDADTSNYYMQLTSPSCKSASAIASAPSMELACGDITCMQIYCEDIPADGAGAGIARELAGKKKAGADDWEVRRWQRYNSFTLDNLSRNEVNDRFSQFQARTWAKIRGGGSSTRSNSGALVYCV